MKTAVSLCTLFTLLVLSCDRDLRLVQSKTTKEENLNNHQKLKEWIQQNGGVINFEVTQLCPTCVRGAYAIDDFNEGDMIAKVPFNLSIKMPADVEYAGGHAYELLTKMYTDPEFNKTYGLFWSTQPTPENVFAPELYSDLHIQELQSEFSASHAAGMKRMTMKYFDGTYEDDENVEDDKFKKHINDVIAPHSIDIDTFSYVSAIIVTREFEFDVEGEDNVYMFPAIDMLNDCLMNECNVERINNDEFVTLVALKNIKKGEQLTYVYQSEVTHRPDMSLLVYGFAMPSDPPLLAAQDLPGFDSKDPFKETPYTDDEYRPTSREEQLKEVERCEGILKEFPTTAEEDEAILKSGKWDGDWKMQEVIKSRMARKKALIYHIKLLKATLSEL